MPGSASARGSVVTLPAMGGTGAQVQVLPPGRRRGLIAQWVLVAVAINGALVLAVLVGNGGDPAIFIHFGRGGRFLALAEHDFGPRVPIPLADGQDGQTFWVLARDPLLLHPHTVLATMDRPAYRAQRIGYPAIASPWGLLGPEGLAWGLVATNLAAVALGAACVTALCLSYGLSPRASLAWSLNPAVVLAVLYDTSDAVALAGLFLVVWAIAVRRWGFAVAGALVAVLAKEPTLAPLVAMAGLAGAAFGARAIRQRVRVVVIPAIAVLGWGIYERTRLGWPPSQIQEFSLPLGGFVEAYRRGWLPTRDLGSALVAIGALGLAIYLVRLWWQDRGDLLLVAALPYALLVPILSGQVLDLPTNSLRAIGAAPTVAAMAYLKRRPSTPGAAP